MKNPVKLSGVIITLNEERNIARCIDSLKGVCDEIVVVDSFSTDSTRDICLSKGAKFIENSFAGHIEQKNFAMRAAKYDYVLSLDADEALSPELKASILEIKSKGFKGAYRFNRFTNYCGQWIKHSGWYPDSKVRLWNKNMGKWGGTNPHDCVVLQDNIKPERIKGDLLHYSYRSLADHQERSVKYTKIMAKSMYSQGKKVSLFMMILKMVFRFFQHYIIRGGILDGFYGFTISLGSSYYSFLKYVYLRELNQGKDIDDY